MTMDVETVNIIEYTVALISEFAKRYRMSDNDAFSYIDEHGGLELIGQCYDIMHTLSFADGVDGLAAYCRRNGGTL